MGFKFKPSDEELVRHYLLNQILGKELPCQGVVTYCDIYGEKEPWEIWNELYRPSVVDDNDRCIYLFTPIKKVTSRGSKINRRVGKSKGTWHGEDSGKKVDKDGLVWIKRRFKYENENCSNQERIWLMQEFSIQGVRNDNNIVLSRIALKISKRKWSDNQVQDVHCPITIAGSTTPSEEDFRASERGKVQEELNSLIANSVENSHHQEFVSYFNGYAAIGEFVMVNGNYLNGVGDFLVEKENCVKLPPPLQDFVVENGNCDKGFPPIGDFVMQNGIFNVEGVPSTGDFVGAIGGNGFEEIGFFADELLSVLETANDDLDVCFPLL